MSLFRVEYYIEKFGEQFFIKLRFCSGSDSNLYNSLSNYENFTAQFNITLKTEQDILLYKEKTVARFSFYEIDNDIVRIKLGNKEEIERMNSKILNNNLEMTIDMKINSNQLFNYESRDIGTRYDPVKHVKIVYIEHDNYVNMRIDSPKDKYLYIYKLTVPDDITISINMNWDACYNLIK